MIIYALLIIVTIIFLRNGIWGTLKDVVISSAEKNIRNKKQGSL